MQYYSLNNASPAVGFKEATIKGQAPDKGLYFPERIPTVSADLIKNMDRYSHDEIAFSVIQPYVGDAIPEGELRKIVAETINFDFPLVPLKRDPGAQQVPTGATASAAPIFALELFHGP